jgi:hypothetical protein
VKYKRIEINAFRRRVTVVSGEWPREIFEAPPAETTDDEVSLSDSDSCEPIEPDSPEGQMIIIEAVRSLERRLSPEVRAAMNASPDKTAPQSPNRIRLCNKLHSLYQRTCASALRSPFKEK